MLTREMNEIITASRTSGWVLEPDAKRLFSMTGLDVPRFAWARTLKDAVLFAEEIGYPVVAKVVSPKVIHKSEVRGVAVGIDSDEKMKGAFERFSRIEGFAGMLVEEMVAGIEMIVGAKVDYQFGPVILLGADAEGCGSVCRGNRLPCCREGRFSEGYPQVRGEGGGGGHRGCRQIEGRV